MNMTRKTFDNVTTATNFVFSVVVLLVAVAVVVVVVVVVTLVQPAPR